MSVPSHLISSSLANVEFEHVLREIDQGRLRGIRDQSSVVRKSVWDGFRPDECPEYWCLVQSNFALLSSPTIPDFFYPEL